MSEGIDAPPREWLQTPTFTLDVHAPAEILTVQSRHVVGGYVGVSSRLCSPIPFDELVGAIHHIPQRGGDIVGQVSTPLSWFCWHSRLLSAFCRIRVLVVLPGVFRIRSSCR